jgi:hypothetical protein
MCIEIYAYKFIMYTYMYKNYEPSVELCLKLIDAALFIGIYIHLYVYIYVYIYLNICSFTYMHSY